MWRSMIFNHRGVIAHFWHFCHADPALLSNRSNFIFSMTDMTEVRGKPSVLGQIFQKCATHRLDFLALLKILSSRFSKSTDMPKVRDSGGEQARCEGCRGWIRRKCGIGLSAKQEAHIALDRYDGSAAKSIALQLTGLTKGATRRFPRR